MRLWIYRLLGAVCLLLAVGAALLAALVRIIICDYPGCGDGRTLNVVLLGAGAVILCLLATWAFIRASDASAH